MTLNYKKSKFNKLKSFCAVVENEDSILKASQVLHISASTVSKDIASLEKDLNYKLFDRIKNKLFLNEKGKEYYKIAKNILLELEKAYSPTFENIDKSEINRVLRQKKIEKVKKKVEICISLINKFINSMLVKITPGRVVSTLGICFIAMFVYLNQTNYWFDKKLKKLANPLLRDVMEMEYYRLDKSIKCPFETIQINIDMANLLLNLFDAKKLNNATKVGITECPSTQLRMSENDAIDMMLFKDNNHFNCDLNARYLGYKTNANLFKKLAKEYDFKYYTIYRKDDCTNNKFYLDNVKASRNIIGFKVSKNNVISDGSFTIFKHKKNYYFFGQLNGAQPHLINSNYKDSYLVFKKLTLDQLKTFDNGSYWKLIKEYNIRID